MKQKWPILIFSALLTAFIVLAGIWGNAQFERLHSGSVLTAEHAAQGIALDGWRQEAPGQWHFTFMVGKDIPSLTLCVTNTAAPLAPESLTSLERSGGAVRTGRHARRDGGAGVHLRPQPPDMADDFRLRLPGIPLPHHDSAHRSDGLCDHGDGAAGALPL